MNTECIFCKFISGEIPVHQKLYEDDDTLAFLDINPNNHGHVLVIPKYHFENIYTLPQETLCRMIITAQKISIAVRQATQADGINILMNNEKSAGQAVFHSHIHIIPRHENDGFWFSNWPHKPYIGDEAEKVAEKIKEEIKK